MTRLLFLLFALLVTSCAVDHSGNRLEQPATEMPLPASANPATTELEYFTLESPEATNASTPAFERTEQITESRPTETDDFLGRQN